MNWFQKFLSPLIILVAFISDRISKEWIIKKLFTGESIEILPFFQITYVENTGMAFGFGQNKNFYFILISIVLIVFLLITHHKSRTDKQTLIKSALALVIGGALGNLYDRIAYGSVIDFLDFFVGSYHWPAFNIADSCVCVGAFLFFLSHYKQKPLP